MNRITLFVLFVVALLGASIAWSTPPGQMASVIQADSVALSDSDSIVVIVAETVTVSEVHYRSMPIHSSMGEASRSCSHSSASGFPLLSRSAEEPPTGGVAGLESSMLPEPELAFGDARSRGRFSADRMEPRHRKWAHAFRDVIPHRRCPYRSGLTRSTLLSHTVTGDA